MNFVRSLFSTRAINADMGLLLIRLGIGLSMLALHGWGKLTGGPEMWTRVGGAMANLGLDFAPVFWGFMAAFSESIGSLFIITGFFFRGGALMLTFTMLVAGVMHMNLPEDNPGHGLTAASHALELMVVYIALFLTGAGKYSLPAMLSKND